MKKIILFVAILFAINLKSIANNNSKLITKFTPRMSSNMSSLNLINSNYDILKKNKKKDKVLTLKKNIQSLPPEINVYIDASFCICADGSLGIEYCVVWVLQSNNGGVVIGEIGGDTCDD